MSMRISFFAGLLASGVLLSGAELSITRATLRPGGSAGAEIRFAAQGSQVAALQVDLHYDEESLRISPSAGSAATAKDKLVNSAEVTPGTSRILVMGFNRSVLADGVVISLQVSSPSGTLGTYSLDLRNAIAADKDGNLIPVATIDGSVSVVSEDGMQKSAALGQVVSGGPWRTTLTLVNVSSEASGAKLSFWGGDGLPLVLPLAFPGPAALPSTATSSLECSLAPGAMLVVETEAPDAPETLAGWAELRSSQNVVGYAVLRWSLGPGRDTETMLAFEQHRGLTLLLPYDNSNGTQTGIVIANQSADLPAEVTLVLRDEAGATVSTEALPLPVRGHTAFLAGDRFPLLAGRRGTIEVQGATSDGIAALGLRFSPSGSFTSIPVISRD